MREPVSRAEGAWPGYGLAGLERQPFLVGAGWQVRLEASWVSSFNRPRVKEWAQDAEREAEQREMT